MTSFRLRFWLTGRYGRKGHCMGGLCGGNKKMPPPEDIPTTSSDEESTSSKEEVEVEPEAEAPVAVTAVTKAAPKGRVDVELSSEPSSAEEEEPSSATEGTPVEEEPAGKKGVEKEKKGPPEPKRERGREVDKRSDKGRSEKGRAEKGGSRRAGQTRGVGSPKAKANGSRAGAPVQSAGKWW